MVGMPAFSTDASFPSGLDRGSMDEASARTVERAVLGFDPATSPSVGMGVIAETFRTRPGTQRSHHPATSICLNGADAHGYVARHPSAWSTGPGSPLGRLRERPSMKILLVGVGWNRCSALHTAEISPTPGARRRGASRRVPMIRPEWRLPTSPTTSTGCSRRPELPSRRPES